MVSIVKENIEIEEALKKKIEFICSFCNTKAEITNGSKSTLEHANLVYIEPHRIIIKCITSIAFNYSNVYLKRLSYLI